MSLKKRVQRTDVTVELRDMYKVCWYEKPTGISKCAYDVDRDGKPDAYTFQKPSELKQKYFPLNQEGRRSNRLGDFGPFVEDPEYLQKCAQPDDESFATSQMNLARTSFDRFLGEARGARQKLKIQHQCGDYYDFDGMTVRLLHNGYRASGACRWTRTNDGSTYVEVVDIMTQGVKISVGYFGLINPNQFLLNTLYFALTNSDDHVCPYPISLPVGAF